MSLNLLLGLMVTIGMILFRCYISRLNLLLFLGPSLTSLLYPPFLNLLEMILFEYYKASLALGTYNSALGDCS
jgi:hypothetical protein